MYLCTIATHVNGECSAGEKFRVFCAWCGNRETFTPVWKWRYSSTVKTVWSANTAKLFRHYTDIRIYHAKQKHLGCKKSARPIRSHNGYISDQKL